MFLLAIAAFGILERMGTRSFLLKPSVTRSDSKSELPSIFSLSSGDKKIRMRKMEAILSFMEHYSRRNESNPIRSKSNQDRLSFIFNL